MTPYQSAVGFHKSSTKAPREDSAGLSVQPLRPEPKHEPKSAMNPRKDLGDTALMIDV